MQKLVEYVFHPQEGIVLLVLPSPLLENNSSCKAENTKLVEASRQFTFVMGTTTTTTVREYGARCRVLSDGET
jgi:hypothetical protein